MSYDPGSHGDRPGQPVGQGWPGGQQYPGGYGQQPPPGPGWGAQQPPAGMPNNLNPSERGGFSALFDFSFANPATSPSLLRFVYIFGTVLIGLYYVVLVIVAFTTSVPGGLIALVLGALVALFFVAFLRLGLELYQNVSRIADDDVRNRR